MHFHGESIGTSCVEIGCKKAKLFKFFLGSSQSERIIVTTILTGSSPRLANRHLGGFLQLFPGLQLLLGNVNDGTSSEYKRLPTE